VVRIGEREIDYRPNIGEYISGPRGTDIRLEDPYARLTAAQRLAARKARRKRPDSELLQMAADGTISTIASAGAIGLAPDEIDEIDDDLVEAPVEAAAAGAERDE
jgi:GTP-binding protein